MLSSHILWIDFKQFKRKYKSNKLLNAFSQHPLNMCTKYEKKKCFSRIYLVVNANFPHTFMICVYQRAHTLEATNREQLAV